MMRFNESRIGLASSSNSLSHPYGIYSPNPKTATIPIVVFVRFIRLRRVFYSVVRAILYLYLE